MLTYIACLGDLGKGTIQTAPTALALGGSGPHPAPRLSVPLGGMGKRGQGPGGLPD